MLLRIFLIPIFSFFVCYAAEHEEQPQTSSLRSVQIDRTPLSFDDFSAVYQAENLWSENKNQWGALRLWFSTMGFYLVRDVQPVRRKQVEVSKKVFTQLVQGEHPAAWAERQIPKILHRIWVTASGTPCEVPEDRLEDFIHTTQQLGEGWQFIFWCLDQSAIPATIGKLRAHENIVVREFNKDFWLDDIRGKAVFKRLLEGGQYVQCSDVVRYKVLYQHGGVYADLGVQFLKDPAPLLAGGYDYVGIHNGTMYATSILAVRPKDAGVNRLLTFFDTLDRIDPTVRQRFAKDRHPYWVGLQALTLIMNRSHKAATPILLLWKNDNPFFRVNHMESWNRPGSQSFGQSKFAFLPPAQRLNLFFLGPWFDAPKVKGWVAGREMGMGSTTYFSTKLYGKEGSFIKQRRAQWIKNMRQNIVSTNGAFKARLNRIPYTSHQMWITKEKQIPETHIAATIQRCRSLGEGWTHILWVMDEEVLAPSIAKLKEGLPGLEVRQVYDFYLRRGETSEEIPHKVKMYGQSIFDGLYAANSFVATTDILRKNVLFKAGPEDAGGGLYADMGISLTINITPLLDCADAAFYVQPESGIFDWGLSAFQPGLKALKETLEIIDRAHTYGFDPSVKYQFGLLGAGLFHACFAQECDTLNVLPLMRTLHFFNNNFNSAIKREPDLGNQRFGDVVRKKSIYEMAKEATV